MHVFDGKHQGTRTYLKGLYTALIRLRSPFHFFFVSTKIENLKREFGEPSNISFVELKSKNKFYRLIFELPNLIRKYDIKYAHYQYISPLFKNCKTIVTTHDILFQQKEFKSFFPFKYRLINGLLFWFSAKRADILLTVSEYSKEKISKIYKILDQNIFVTPNAVDSDFEELDHSVKFVKEGKTILYVSRVEPRKNHIILVQAFLDLELYKKGYKLVFIGAHDFPGKKLLEFIESNNRILKGSIVWRQNIPIDLIKHYYANCDLFVFPSYAEGFGIPVLEAMTFNSKILVSNQTAMKDFNLPDELTFAPDDLIDLKSKITNILSIYDDKHTRKFEEILSKYSWNKSAEVLLDAISRNNKLKPVLSKKS